MLKISFAQRQSYTRGRDRKRRKKESMSDFLYNHNNNKQGEFDFTAIKEKCNAHRDRAMQTIFFISISV